MSFLNPIMLGGLLAIGIPILIHLLNRRRFQKVVWAAMRFLQVSVEKNKRRMEIEDLILLALRCLLVALIALALARPTVRDAVSSFLGGGKTVGVVMIDNSMSMGVSDGTATRFTKAKQAAEQAIDSLPSGSAVAVWLVSDMVRDSIPEPTYDLNLARKAIREATLTDRGTDLTGALDRAVEMLRTRIGSRREIYLFTDGQRVGWRGLLEAKARLERAKDEVRVHMVLVNEKDTRNLSVRDLRLANGLAPVGQPLRFEIKVQNHGSQPLRDVRVTLNVDQDPASDEFTLATLGPGESKGIALFAKLRTDGIHAVHANVGEDRLPSDNRRTLAVRALKQLKVLLVEGQGGDEANSRETFFLRHAFNPVPAEQIANYFIKLQTVPASELTTVSLDDFDVLVMANVARFSEKLVPSLLAYVRRGGGLLFFPGDRTDAAFYNEQWVNKQSFLPAALGPLRGQAEGSDQFFSYQSKDFSHPISLLWNDPAAGTLASARIFRHFILLPSTAETNRTSAGRVGEGGIPQVVVAFADSSPAIMERSFGMGRVVEFCTTADTRWNDLAVRPAFIPLLHRILGAVVSRQDEGLNLRVGAKFARRVTSDLLGKEAAFTRPGVAEGTRDLRRIEMIQETPSLVYEKTDLAGLYTVQVADPPFELAFAAHTEADESNLEELSVEQVQAIRSVAEVYNWTPQFSLRQMVERQRSGVEFWTAVLTAALALALCECFLAQWFSRSR